MWTQAATDRMISSWPSSKDSNYAEWHKLQCQGPPWLWSTARHNSGREIMTEIMHAGAAAIGGTDRRLVTELAEDGTKPPSRIRTTLRISMPNQGDGGVNR